MQPHPSLLSSCATRSRSAATNRWQRSHRARTACVAQAASRFVNSRTFVSPASLPRTLLDAGLRLGRLAGASFFN
jgi:hypothetical protein